MAAQGRREPIRTCVGCRQAEGRPGLIRLVRGPDGAALPDPTGRAPGRGAYLHRDAGCIDTARRRRSLERALRATVPESTWETVRRSAS